MPNLDLSAGVLREVQDVLGVRFADPVLLKQALVHRSLINEADLDDADCNERLEFLGDAALSLVTAQLLFERYPDRAEGQLSHARASLVNLNTLGRFAQQIDMGKYLQLGRGEDRSGGRARGTVAGRGFEAVLGAIYLDRGLATLRDFLTPILEAELEAYGWGGPAKDFKSRLQELLQAERGETPVYRVLAESGPDHAKEFEMAAEVGAERLGVGRGSSKQRAEQAAARVAVEALTARKGD
jgi:ribonuclease-3